MNLVVFAFDESWVIPALQSACHEAWVNANSSTLETRQGYRPSDCFETFPFPCDVTRLGDLGDRYQIHRQEIMRSRGEGLTKIYNRLHDPAEVTADIAQLRELHVDMDRAVASLYGWDNAGLGHGFHQTRQGIRFTISEAARREVLARLLKLNHERYAEEVARGLHDKKRRRAQADDDADEEADGLFTDLAEP